VEEGLGVHTCEAVRTHPGLEVVLLTLLRIAVDDSAIGLNDTPVHFEPFRALREIEEHPFIVLPRKHI
jgi:hypothetical protein